MKKKDFIFILVSLLVLSSCDDYFEPDYTGSITEERLYDNMNALRMGLSTVYNVVQISHHVNSRVQNLHS